MDKAQKHDYGKPDLSLVPRVAMQQMALAFMNGEQKYGRWNYCKGLEASRLVGAIRRHLAAWNDGEDNDRDSTANLGVTVSHLGCALAGLAMILRMQELGTLKDDRYKHPQQLDEAFEMPPLSEILK